MRQWKNRIALFVFGSLIGSSVGMGADDYDPPRVTVYGTATKEVVPDIMNWQLSVQNKEATVEKVAEAHTQSVQAVLDFLKREQVPADCVQTSEMRFGENWIYQDRNKKRDGYVASTSVSFKLHDLQKYQQLWGGISRLPDVSLNGVQLDTSKRIEHRDETRKKALLAARKKASALAETLGSAIGKPLLIEEELNSFPMGLAANSNMLYRNQEDSENSGSSLAPGTIPIRMRVRVSFLLEKDTP